jgi:hypothetical protein
MSGTLTWNLDVWAGCRELDRRPPLTPAPGTAVARTSADEQPATAAGAPTDHARVCLAAHPPASATLSGFAVDQSKRPRPARDNSRSPQLRDRGDLRPVAGPTCSGLDVGSVAQVVSGSRRGFLHDLARVSHGRLLNAGSCRSRRSARIYQRRPSSAVRAWDAPTLDWGLPSCRLSVCPEPNGSSVCLAAIKRWCGRS